MRARPAEQTHSLDNFVWLRVKEVMGAWYHKSVDPPIESRPVYPPKVGSVQRYWAGAGQSADEVAGVRTHEDVLEKEAEAEASFITPCAK